MQAPWESCRGRGATFLKLGPTLSSAGENGVSRKGRPAPQSLPGHLPPCLLTYEVAHGGRIGIPVTLRKRHGSRREPGPGNLTPPISGSRLHPLGPLAPPLRPRASRAPGQAECLPGRGRAPGGAPGQGDTGRGPGARAHLPRAPRDGRGGGAPRSRGDARRRSGPRWPSRLHRAGLPWELETQALIAPPTGKLLLFSAPLAPLRRQGNIGLIIQIS